MTNNEQKALELDLIARVIGAYHTTRLAGTDANEHILGKPHVREAFDRLAEADKARHAAEMREQAERFSDAAGKTLELLRFHFDIKETSVAVQPLAPYLTAPVDPLVEALEATGDDQAKERAWRLHGQLAERGFEVAPIVKKEAV